MFSWPTHPSDWGTEAPEYYNLLKAAAKWWDGGGSQVCSVDTFQHGLREHWEQMRGERKMREGERQAYLFHFLWSVQHGPDDHHPV